MKKGQFSAGIGLLILVISFIMVSYFIQNNPDFIENVIGGTSIDNFAVIFTLVVIIGTIFIPLTFIPLIPLSVFTHGWIFTAIYIVIGQFVGAIISFAISRKYGVPLVSKIISLEEIERYEKALPKENLFWAIVLIRIAIPLDALSYILGLFRDLKLKTFAIATFLGIIPSAITLSYLGSLELKYQLISFAMFVIVILIGYGLDVRYRQGNKLKKVAN